jgi:hypothetical protein
MEIGSRTRTRMTGERFQGKLLLRRKLSRTFESLRNRRLCDEGCEAQVPGRQRGFLHSKGNNVQSQARCGDSNTESAEGFAPSLLSVSFFSKPSNSYPDADSA